MNLLRALLVKLSRIPPAVMLIAIASGAFLVTYLITTRMGEIERVSTNARDEMLRRANQTTKVVYAATDIPEGECISSQILEEKEIPVSRVPADALSSASLALGKIAKYGIVSGQIISQHDLTSCSQLNKFESRLKGGMRAVTFGVDNNTGVAGFVSPESRIDIYGLAGSGPDTKACPVLSDVEVIATGQIFEKTSGTGGPVPTNSFTVAVTPDEARQLMKAISASKLYVALRNPIDHTPLPTEDISNLFKKPNDSGAKPLAIMPGPPTVLPDRSIRQEPPGQKATAPEAKAHEVEMWFASKKDIVSFGG